jgi:hypothetical protein
MWELNLEVSFITTLVYVMFIVAHLYMKEGSLFVLFCSYEIHQIKMLQIVFLVCLESSQGRGVHWLGCMMFGLVMQKFLNIE